MAEIYDVVIVGSGAGGSMMSYVLTQAGVRVAIVEAGGHNMDHDIRHHEWPWEQRYRNVYKPDSSAVRLTTKQYVVGAGEREVEHLFDGNAHFDYYDDHFLVKLRDWRYTFPDGQPYRWVRARSIGGKTNCWGTNCCRWGPLEFKPYSYDGYGVDWPISYDEIAPWYSKVEELIGVSGEKSGQASACPDGEYMDPPGLPCGLQIMKAAGKRLGYISTAGPHAIITKAHNGRPACHYCGRCGRGCDVGAKFTAVGTLYPTAFATGKLTMFSNAIVREITVDSRGRASGVKYIDRYRMTEGEVKGRHVIVSASAIETARLLLNSKSAQFPDGLANSSGQVGKHLVEDVVAGVSGELPQLHGREVVNEDSYQPDTLFHPKVNVDAKSRSKDYLHRYYFRAGGGFGFGGGGRGIGGAMKKDARENYGSSIGLAAAGCGLESPDNFVDIDPNVKDAWGIPAVRIHFKHTPNAYAMVKDAITTGSELIEAAGGKVTSYTMSPSIPGAQIHEQGTCRMGNDRNKFVVNSWGRTYDVPNLTLADGSIHCTCGITDPTLTILSITMRNANRLVEEVRQNGL